ncbi:MAG: peptidylprolyl isomerase [Planctomycetota bacterium]
MTDAQQGPRVVLKTTAGDMTLAFRPDKAPGHVENFLKLAREGFYTGTRFHRVIPGFMIQGGDPNTRDDGKGPWGTGGPGYQIKAEFNDLPHKRGVLSMARSQNPDSAGSQFFICHGDARGLDGQYTVFGMLVEGEDTLDEIAGAPCERSGEGSRPKNPVQIESITVLED